MDPESRKALLTQCPAIFKALGNALREASAQAATVGTDDEQKQRDDASTDPETRAEVKTKVNMTARSSNMLKAKRLKPLLGCLSATVSADSEDGGGALKGMVPEVRDVKHALKAAGEACASLPMQLLCNRAVEELDRVRQGEAVATAQEPRRSGSEDREGRKNERRKCDESMSPGAKRKAEGTVKPASDTGDAGEVGGEGKKHKSHKSSKKKGGSLDV